MTFRARSWGRGTGNLAVVEDAGFAALESGEGDTQGEGVELIPHPLGGIQIWMTGGVVGDKSTPYRRLIGVVHNEHHKDVTIPGFTPGEFLVHATSGWPPVSEEA